jgi:hypothetical protein
MELTKQKNYQQSFDLACASIKEVDLKERAEKAEADHRKGEDGEKIVIHFFLNLSHPLSPDRILLPI